MNKTYSTYLTIILLIIILFIMTNISYAINTDSYKPNEIQPEEYSSATVVFSKVIRALRYISIVVMVIGLSLLGFRYMMGSNSEKAEYKETMLPFIFGAVFVFSVTYVLQLIATIE